MMVAEGVESEAALAKLARLGCDLAQGYHISKPLPAERRCCIERSPCPTASTSPLKDDRS